MPVRDQWGHPFLVWTRENCSANTFGIELSESETTWGDDAFIVGSTGRNTSPTDYGTFDPTNPAGSLYEVGSMQDFNKEIVNWNGSMVVGPRTAAAAS